MPINQGKKHFPKVVLLLLFYRSVFVIIIIIVLLNHILDVGKHFIVIKLVT